MKQTITLLLIVLGAAVCPAGLFAQGGAKTYTDAYMGLDFVEIKAGTFTMGCTAEQGSDCPDSSKPPHKVTLTEDYWMAKHEVTQLLWRKVMGANPSYTEDCDKCPVDGVSWAEVQAFLSKLRAQTGMEYRLPTEAEWEYAARAGQKAAGTKYAGSNTLGDVAWYNDNSGSKTHPVGQKAANELGLYDMSGNVFEWCADWFDYSYSSGAKTDTAGPSSGTYRVLRGGSWDNFARGCRVSSRVRNSPDSRSYIYGFRLCLDAPNRVPPLITSAAAASVAENTTGTVYTATATDDVSAAEEITFSLVAGVKDNDLFSLNGADIGFKAVPDYENPLDADKNNVYELELTATDADGNANTKLVSITVTDVDDTPPVITSAAALSVAERTFGTIYTATATDNLSAATEITFSLVAGVKDNDLFVLEGVALSFNTATLPDYANPADADKNNIYELELTARDAANNVAVKAIAVTVTDLADDTAPVITSAATLAIDENTTGVVYTATATDNASAAEDISFSLPAGVKDNDLFSLARPATPGRGAAVSFKASPDFENPADADKNNVYELELIARDEANNVSTKVVSITVNNIGELPQITSPVAVKVAEHSPVATLIYTAEATPDIDSGPGITFSLAAGTKDHDAFSLLVDKLYFKKVPDFEKPLDADKNNVYELELTATDAAGLSNTKVVTVTVTDLADDTAPVITSASAVSVPERTPGTIYTATATDNASAATEISFSLAGGVKNNDLFELTGADIAFTGTTPLYNAADASANVYELELTATDAANNVATKLVTVIITDLADDTAPVITSLPTFSVPERTPGTIYTATATDNASEAAEISFSLAAGVKNNDLFELKGADIAFAGTTPVYDATDATANVYELELTARDAANNAGKKAISITVTNVVNEPEYIDPYTGMFFEKVEKGSFTMGCSAEQGSNCWTNEKPAHQVTLTNDYYMGKYEVTQAQWFKVMNSKLSYFTENCDNCPVENVSWNNIQEFITKLNAELKKSDPKKKYRLPTEAEWEYAARGGHKSTSTTYSGSNTRGDVAWHSANSENKTHPVGQKKENELGLHDMSGNVWEWCADHWKRDYTATAVTNPKGGPASGSGARVLRGGSWNDQSESCRVAVRTASTGANNKTGFRLCLIWDDTPPVITSAATANVAENTFGTVYTATATDNISEAADLTFSLAAGITGTGVKDNDLFSLKGAEIRFKTLPDYEKPTDADKNNVYELQLTATDAAGNASLPKTVWLTVTDVATEPAYIDLYTGMTFEKVEKGSFDMSGGPRVTLTKDYLMAKYEVTQAQWVKVMGSNPSNFGGCDNCPVDQVSWNDARSFITKLNAALKKANPQAKEVYRLPTEAEWEYAAKGGHKAPATATTYSGSNTAGEVAWTSENASGKTHPVGQKKANELALYDMSGNVREWCADWYGSYPSTAVTDPKGPATGTYRVMRGGGWYNGTYAATVGYRFSVSPGNAYSYFGFRLCLEVPDRTPPVVTSPESVSVSENVAGVFYKAAATDEISEPG